MGCSQAYSAVESLSPGHLRGAAQWEYCALTMAAELPNVTLKTRASYCLLITVQSRFEKNMHHAIYTQVS